MDRVDVYLDMSICLNEYGITPPPIRTLTIDTQKLSSYLPQVWDSEGPNNMPEHDHPNTTRLLVPTWR